MRPFIEEMCGKEKTPAQLVEHEVMKAVRKENHGRKCRQKELDQRHINSVGLRAQRYARLEVLKAQAALAERGDESVPMIADGPADCLPSADTCLVDATHTDAATCGGTVPVLASRLRHCYMCKARFDVLHAFYDQLCPSCAELNWRKRNQSADLSGRVALVTGGRVKIGFHIALKLLHAGAAVLVTTRFPCDAAQRFRAEAEREQKERGAAAEWFTENRLRIVAIDLRDAPAIERFTGSLLASPGSRLDIIVHNACQTVRRPPAYYAELVDRELSWINQLQDAAGDSSEQTLALPEEARRMVVGGLELLRESGAEGCEDAASISAMMAALPVPARVLVPLVPGDAEVSTAESASALFPRGAVDHASQQLDLRQSNSWLLPIDEVSTVEAAEALAINALAPFVMNSRLIPLMRRSPGQATHKFIVNVSAMEGKFYRNKTANHPHTNMAKAALNMQTRTCAAALARDDHIFMNAVDTGWINDENPLPRAARTAERHNFQTPIDEIDAAARVLDPIFDGVNGGTPASGIFFKDYHETEW
jgi:NAD(P)-dependent dehydrogenase (short-subunit alcohol dehydrogenase family)